MTTSLELFCYCTATGIIGSAPHHEAALEVALEVDLHRTKEQNVEMIGGLEAETEIAGVRDREVGTRGDLGHVIGNV